jgi:hypothetical protein
MMRGLVCVALVACASGGDPLSDETEVSADELGKADAAELSVRAGETTLTVAKDLALRTGPDGAEFVLRGKTSRTLADGRGFIFDDVYGDWAKKSARVFELTWPVSTARSLVDGVDQFIGLSFVHSSTRPDHLTARVVVRPRLAAFTGSSKIYLTAELTPVVVGGTVVYRISGRSTGANTGVTAYLEDDVEHPVQRIDDQRFTIDLAPEQAFALAAAGKLHVIVDYPGGGVEKFATLGLAIKKLGFTAGDVETVWPPLSCATAVRTCLQALPDGALDLGGCGEAVKVNACAGQVGVFVDPASFSATLAKADARLATPASHADAVALVGSDKANELLFGAKETIEYKLQLQFGRWYLSQAARTTALDNALEAGLDVAYARPLELVEPHPVIPGNAAAMRQVAADAVLAELDRMDFVHTEFARSLEHLARQFRAQHVASIRAFRETIVAEPYPGTPTWDVYLGDWLGCYTEVVVEKSTGNVVRTLVEID